jgi:alpha-beta hydrolase superfamily lysophospholipase
MGSLVSVDAVAHGALRPQRLVLSAPVTEIRAPLPGWMVGLLRQASKVAPRAKLSPLRFVHGKTCLPRLTSDDAYMHYLKNIPHRVGGFTLEFLTNFHNLMRETQQCAARIDVPTLMLSAGRDIFIRPEQSRAFFDCIAAPEKEYVFYPQSHHLLWHDIDTDDVLERITRWITEDRA